MRTSNSSSTALFDLGYKDIYHFSSLLQENPLDQMMWIEAFEAQFHGRGSVFDRSDWDQLLGHCPAVTDTPCRTFWRGLLESYPDVKVVVTIRDTPDVWFESMMTTIMPFNAEFVGLPEEPGRWSLWKRAQHAIMNYQNTEMRFHDLVLSCDPMYQVLCKDYI